MPPRKKKAKTLTEKEQRLRDAKWKGYGDAIKDAQGGVASPEPTDPKKLDEWDFSNVDLFTGDEISREDLLTEKQFLLKGGKCGTKSERKELWALMKAKIEAYAAAPAEAAREAAKTEQEATFRATNEWLGDLDDAQQVAKLYDGSDVLTMGQRDFYPRGGRRPAWDEATRLKNERTVQTAEDEGKRRASDRVVTTPDWLRPGENDNDGKAPYGHKDCSAAYWRDKDPTSATAIACVEVGMRGPKKL